jgi:hypothetical protein
MVECIKLSKRALMSLRAGDPVATETLVPLGLQPNPSNKNHNFTFELQNPATFWSIFLQFALKLN